MINDQDQHLKVFRAFCDKKRLMIIEMLKDGELCACDILDQLSISQSTLSHHMKILCDSNVLTARKSGKWVYYSINPEGCVFASELLLKLTSLN